jgi:exonuclease VII large subunit
MSLSVIYNLNAQGLNKYSAKEFGTALTKIGNTIAEHYQNEDLESLEDLFQNKKSHLQKEYSDLEKELKRLMAQEKSSMNRIRVNQKTKGSRLAKCSREKQNARSEYVLQKIYELNLSLKQKKNQIQIIESIG